MNEEIKKIVDDAIKRNQTAQQFGVSKIQAHIHNGTDSLSLFYNNLLDKVHFWSFALHGTSPATAGNYSTFFIAPFAMTILQIQEVHTTAGTDAGAVTLNIEKLTGTTAPGAGTSLLSTGFNLKGTINTIQTGSLASLVSTKNLAAGDRLALVLTGTPTAVANLVVSLVISY